MLILPCYFEQHFIQGVLDPLAVLFNTVKRSIWPTLEISSVLSDKSSISVAPYTKVCLYASYSPDTSAIDTSFLFKTPDGPSSTADKQSTEPWRRSVVRSMVCLKTCKFVDTFISISSLTAWVWTMILNSNKERCFLAKASNLGRLHAWLALKYGNPYWC